MEMWGDLLNISEVFFFLKGLSQEILLLEFTHFLLNTDVEN